MRVRPARPADLAAVEGIAAASPTAPHWTRAQFKEVLAPEAGSMVQRAMLVAEDVDRLTGFAVVSALTALFPVEAELESIAVDPRGRRRGVGSALLGAVFAWCRQKGAASLRLEVRVSNGNAISLYERFGFQRDGVRSSYYASPTEDAICMLCTNLFMETLPFTE